MKKLGEFSIKLIWQSRSFLTVLKKFSVAGKSMSEALIFASTIPQYDNRLFIELTVRYIKIPSSEHGGEHG